jgi:hypothetical protein
MDDNQSDSEDSEVEDGDGLTGTDAL